VPSDPPAPSSGTPSSASSSSLFPGASPSAASSTGASPATAGAGGNATPPASDPWLGDPTVLHLGPPSPPPAAGPGAPGSTGNPIPVGRGPRRVSRKLVTTYFAGGLALLLLGVVAAGYLTYRAYGQATESITSSRDGLPAVSTSRVPASPRPASAATPGAPAAVRPSAPLRARFGPQKLTDGQSFVMRGEGDSRFQVTLKAGKWRKSCSPYGVKAKKGGYLPVKLTLRVLEGEPQVSEYSFRFQEADGTWLDSVGGSGCDGDDYLGFFRRQSVGRTYTSTVIYDVPSRKGDIVFVYPLMDVAAEWRLG
jgi:hypothetical protein